MFDISSLNRSRRPQTSSSLSVPLVGIVSEGGGGDVRVLTGEEMRWLRTSAAEDFSASSSRAGGGGGLPVRCRGPDRPAVELLRRAVADLAETASGWGGGKVLRKLSCFHPTFHFRQDRGMMMGDRSAKQEAGDDEDDLRAQVKELESKLEASSRRAEEAEREREEAKAMLEAANRSALV